MPEGSVRVLFVSSEQPDWPGIVANSANELSHGILRALSHAAELVWKVHYLLPLLASSVTSAA